MNGKTDVVIPALNEALLIRNIIQTLAGHPNIGNIIVVVDEQTTDETVRESENANRIITGPHGKGECVTYGLVSVTSSRVMFCDADITGLTAEHITALTLMPMGRKVGYRPQVIGVPDLPRRDIVNLPPQFNRQRFVHAWPWVSGERCLDTEIALRQQLTGYLMEVQLNEAHKAMGRKTVHVPLAGVRTPVHFTDQRMEDMRRDYERGMQMGILP